MRSPLCVAKVIGLADSRESPDIYIHSRTDINPLRPHPASISGKIGGSLGPRPFLYVDLCACRERGGAGKTGSGDTA